MSHVRKRGDFHVRKRRPRALSVPSFKRIGHVFESFNLQYQWEPIETSTRSLFQVTVQQFLFLGFAGGIIDSHEEP